MGSRFWRTAAAAALVFTMSTIVGLVVLSPLVWRDGSSPGPAPEALPARDEVAEVVAPEPEPEETAKTPPTRAGQARPLQACRGDACVAREAAAPAGQARPVQGSRAATPPPAVVDKKGKAKGHEKKGLGSEKAGKHGHHAQGAPGKGHGKGKSKDRDRAPARARG